MSDHFHIPSAESIRAKLTECTKPTLKTNTAIRPQDLIGDNRGYGGHTQDMNDITREEFNARLETIEVKMDARVEAISSKIDGFLAAQAERDRRLDESIAGVRRDIDRLGSLKLNIWGAMLTAVGLGVAMAALSVTFYQTGKADSPNAASMPPAISAPPAVTPKN
ncbi:MULTISPECIES: hypothetical protein [Pseudomonas]|uniref:hypothetical protein n=1 Tax=Pseudomonas TaxID=286 RepID=UPI0025810126|nr:MULTISPECIES: hypothetical protein [Pseudomonas]MDP9539328.1 hypothetical protein [Pseudomonas putida]MDV5386563.1 hypothetical protein [Pseudomonas juntendi]